MADDAAAAEARTTLKRVLRFQFDCFAPDNEEWTYYIQRFENEWAIHGILTGPGMEDHRRNLLLSRVGPEAFKILVDHFRPTAVNTCTYDELKQFFQKSFCIMVERVVFAQRCRKE